MTFQEHSMPDDETWQNDIVQLALADALNSDGSIDFDKLWSKGNVITLTELFPNFDEME